MTDSVSGRDRTEVDALIVGGGPAGLAAAVQLRRSGASVIVVERDGEAGGVARHSNHLGYGVRDLHRLLNGPAYAKAWTERAIDAGADLRVRTTATGWVAADEGHALTVTSPAGVEEIRARTILLATGCRERPRSARLVPGSRPAGILTTGSLQRLVHLQGARAVRRAVVVGAEHVSYSAVMTIAHAGGGTVAMLTHAPSSATFPAVDRAARVHYRFPLRTMTTLTEIHGQQRVEGVTIRDVRTGTNERLACDAVVFTGDWVPDHELARGGALPLSLGFGAPDVDAFGRTARPGIFAAGNLLHGACTADTCAHEGRRAAGAMAAHLDDSPWPEATIVLVADDPVAWVSPGRLSLASQDLDGVRLVAAVRAAANGAHVLRQGTKEVRVTRRRTWVPGRLAYVAGRHLRSLDPMSGPLHLAID